MIHGMMQDYPLTLDKFLTHAARWHGDAEVVTARDDGRIDRIGYAKLRTRSLAISSLLLDFGICHGDRVATLAWNSQAHVELWYAAMGIGAVCHTLNPRLTGPQLASMAVQSGAKLLIVSADLLPLARLIVDRAPAIMRVLAIDGPASEWPAAAPPLGALEPLLADAPGGARWGDFDERAPAGLCFTSGTTGAPKGVTYTHRGTFLHTLRTLQADVMAFTSRDAVLAVVPMFHANAWGLPFAVPAVGGKLVLPGRRADGASLARLIAAEGVTIGVGVPTVWLGLLDHLETVGGDLPSLQRIIVGGAPMAPALMDRIERRLGVTVQTSWGMTELSPLGTITAPGDPLRSASVSGRPAIGLDLLLTDAAGRALPDQQGVEGHLRVRGPAVIDRYFGEADSALDADGWFGTGDLARIDARGNLSITGRAKDLIKSGGEWINPAEIEAVVGALPQVSLAAVIGRDDAKWGERPVLLVELATAVEISDADLLAPLAGRVAPWWIPDAVIRLPAMPLAPTGKIDKIRLRNDYGAS
jgi:fatty-acyl-CoA synthase